MEQDELLRTAVEALERLGVADLWQAVRGQARA